MSNFMEGIGTGLSLVAFILLVFGIGIGIGTMALLDDGKIKSKTRIEPQIELIINNNQVDTLFVYELK